MGFKSIILSYFELSNFYYEPDLNSKFDTFLYSKYPEFSDCCTASLLFPKYFASFDSYDDGLSTVRGDFSSFDGLYVETENFYILLYPSSSSWSWFPTTFDDKVGCFVDSALTSVVDPIDFLSSRISSLEGDYQNDSKYDYLFNFTSVDLVSQHAYSDNTHAFAYTTYRRLFLPKTSFLKDKMRLLDNYFLDYSPIIKLLGGK